MEGKLKHINCFNCEVWGKITPATVIVEYMGVKTPICKKCYKSLLDSQEIEPINE